MTEEQKAAYINAQCVMANAEIQGMIAENQHRMSCGHSVAYCEDAFAVVQDKYGLHHNQVLEFFNN